MAGSINKVILIGHLGRDPEIRRTASGDPVASILKKGSKVYIEGQLQTRKWQDQSDADRYSTEVVLQKFRGEIALLDKTERAAPDPDGYGETRTRDTSQGYGAVKDGGTIPPSGGSSHLDDDIPF